MHMNERNLLGKNQRGGEVMQTRQRKNNRETLKLAWLRRFKSREQIKPFVIQCIKGYRHLNHSFRFSFGNLLLQQMNRQLAKPKLHLMQFRKINQLKVLIRSNKIVVIDSILNSFLGFDHIGCNIMFRFWNHQSRQRLYDLDDTTREATVWHKTTPTKLYVNEEAVYFIT